MSTSATPLRIASSQEKLPPQAVEAEQALLGGLLLNNDQWDKIADQIKPADFYERRHTLIFEAIGKLRKHGRAADVVTVAEQLQTDGSQEQVGGMHYIGTLANNTPSTANILAYAKIVREHAALRSLITASNEIIDSAYQPEGRDTREILNQAESRILRVSEHDERSRESYVPISGLIASSVNLIEERGGSDDPLTGVSTGFNDINNKTAGLQRGDLIIVAGRPSMGKTAFALNMVEHIALLDEKKQPGPVLMFSMEMSGAQIAMRLLSSHAMIPSGRIRTGKLRDGDWPRIGSAEKVFENAPIYIDDSSGLDPLTVLARARRLARDNNNKLGLIVIDYLQLMQAEKTGDNRVAEMTNITRNLKMLARELDVPVVALSQLNRGVESRDNRRPVMSDLRESGSIEQDADVIFFIYRDEVYNEETKDRGLAEIIIGKQRNGPIGTVKLTFRGEFTRFENHVAERYAASDDYAADYAAGFDD